MSSVIIILKIEVSARQPLGTPLLYPEKGPQSEENRPLLSEGYGPIPRLQMWGFTR